MEYDFRGKRVRGIVQLAIAHAEDRAVARLEALRAVAGMYKREVGDGKSDREAFLARAESAWEDS
jgi:hypothetical protein